MILLFKPDFFCILQFISEILIEKSKYNEENSFSNVSVKYNIAGKL